MATIKSYTDISQSKKLAEILPLESADMVYVHTTDLEGDEHYDIDFRNNQPLFDDDIPAWNLAALLDVLPEGIIDNCYVPNLQKENGKYSIAYGDDELLCIADNPIDACYELILKLHELNLL